MGVLELDPQPHLNLPLPRCVRRSSSKGSERTRVQALLRNRRRILKHQLTLLVGHPAEEVLGVYAEESPVTLTGEAGLGFVEDPFGFHMGTVPTRAPRLMMEVGFGVSPPSRRRFHGEPIIR